MVFNPSAKDQKKFLEASKPFLPITPLEGPLEVNIIFYFKRPKNHYKSGKNSHLLKDNIDIWHNKRKGN